MAILEDRIVKKAHSSNTFTTKQIRQLARCYNNPKYFMENFVYIQHPTQGRLLLNLYPFQREMVDAIHDNRFSILLTARQMGKCLSKLNKIKLRNKNEEEIEIAIGDFYEWQKFKEWCKTVPELQEYLCRNKNK